MTDLWADEGFGGSGGYGDEGFGGEDDWDEGEESLETDIEDALGTPGEDEDSPWSDEDDG